MPSVTQPAGAERGSAELPAPPFRAAFVLLTVGFVLIIPPKGQIQAEHRLRGSIWVSTLRFHSNDHVCVGRWRQHRGGERAGWPLCSRAVLQHTIQMMTAFLVLVSRGITTKPLSMPLNTLLCFSHYRLTS